MKEDRGLSDKELAAKYEAGSIDLVKVLQKVISERHVVDKKANKNSKIKNK